MNVVEQKIDQLSQQFQVLGQKFDQKFEQLDQKFEKLDGRVGNLEQTVDKIVMTTLDLQVDMKDVKSRMHILEDQIGPLYNRIDQFLVILNNHDAEIAAVRSSDMRMNERLTVLEAKR